MFGGLALVTSGLVALGTAALLGTGGASLLAHEKFRIVGTVVKVQATQPVDLVAVEEQLAK